MQVLGIRTAPTCIRYAVVTHDGDAATLVNASDENRLDFPADVQSIGQKLHWLHQELDRVFRRHSGITRIVVKSNEFGRGGERSSSREAAYLDSVALLVAEQHGIDAITTLYRNMGTRRAEVKTFAEEKVGASASYWNEQMADAVAAAWHGATLQS